MNNGIYCIRTEKNVNMSIMIKIKVGESYKLFSSFQENEKDAFQNALLESLGFVVTINSEEIVSSEFSNQLVNTVKTLNPQHPTFANENVMYRFIFPDESSQQSIFLNTNFIVE